MQATACYRCEPHPGPTTPRHIAPSRSQGQRPRTTSRMHYHDMHTPFLSPSPSSHSATRPLPYRAPSLVPAAPERFFRPQSSIAGDGGSAFGNTAVSASADSPQEWDDHARAPTVATMSVGVSCRTGVPPAEGSCALDNVGSLQPIPPSHASPRYC